MYLLIDASEHSVFHFTLFDETTRITQTYGGALNTMLEKIDVFLQSENSTKESIQGIIFVQGTGSFTSSRIAAVIGNVFSYALNISVRGITKEQASNPQAFIAALTDTEAGVPVDPMYSGEPNIRKSLYEQE